jgi:hypothetical protein
MSKLNVQLKDTILLDIHTSEYSYNGCPTCDFGRIKVNEIELEFTDYRVTIEIESDAYYSEVLTVSDLIMYFCNLTFSKLVFNDFIINLRKFVESFECENVILSIVDKR